MKHSLQGHELTEIILQTFNLSGLLITEGDKLTKCIGLSSARWKILGALARSDSALSAAQIARVMGQTRQAVQRLVDIMQQQDLLIFSENPNHKRAKLISMSYSGKTIYKQLDKQQIQWVNEIAKNLSVEDLRTTLATLNKIALSLN